MKKILLTLAALLLVSSAYGLDCEVNCYNVVVTTPEFEFDNSISVGVAGSVGQSPYKKYDASWMIAPLVLHDSKYFYLQGTSGGFYLFNNGTHKISAGISYFGLEFDRHDTDNRQLKQLDSRRSTLMGEIGYSVVTPIGLASFELGRDLLGHSDGYVADASLGVPWITDRFTIMPTVGVTWSSRKQSDYYFGISRGESNRSGLKQHTAKANFSPYIEVEMKYNITERWSAVAGVNVNFLTGSVKNSPMVGRSATVGGFLGCAFKF